MRHDTPKLGRPTKFTEKLAEQICEEVASTPLGIVRLCKLHDYFPNHDTIYKWLYKYPSFSEQYYKAKQQQIAVLVDEVLEIADDTSRDTLLNNDGFEVCNNEYINRSRLRIETRKWLAMKLLPKVYGDRAHTESKDENSHAKSLEELE